MASRVSVLGVKSLGGHFAQSDSTPWTLTLAASAALAKHDL